MTKPNDLLRGNLLALLYVCISGLTFSSTKVLLDTFSPVQVMFSRFLLGFLALLLLGGGPLHPTDRRHEATFALAGLTGVTLYFLMENVALVYADASIVGVLVAIAPLCTALAVKLLLGGEVLGRNFFLGFLIAISGIALVSLSGVSGLAARPLGCLLALAAALTWGFYSAFARKLSGYGYPVIPMTGRILFWGVVFLLPVVVFFGGGAPLSAWLEMKNAGNLLFLGLIASAGGYVIWNTAVEKLGAVRTSQYIYLVPVINILFSFLILHEHMTPLMWCGTALALLGLVVSEHPLGRGKTA